MRKPTTTNQVGCGSEKTFAMLDAVSTTPALSNVLYVRLIQISSPVFATSVTYLIPIVAIGWGLLDGEIITLLHSVGIALILSGIFLVNRRFQNKS